VTKDVYELRLLNLRQLIAKHKGPTSLARKLGHANGSQISQHTTDDLEKRRRIGEKFARSVEEKLKLPAGWMDQPHEGAEPSVSAIDVDRLQLVIALVDECARDTALTPRTRSEIITLAYDLAAAGRPLDRNVIARLVALATRE
jgi:hypothetical protein